MQAVFSDHADNVCRSPERPDLRLSKEEAQGHLAGNLVIGELLPVEARAVGKRVDNHIMAEAEASKKASKRAKEKRRTARAKADEAARREAALAKVEADIWPLSVPTAFANPPSCSCRLEALSFTDYVCVCAHRPS